MFYFFVLCFKLEALRFHSLNATNMEEIDKILKRSFKFTLRFSIRATLLNSPGVIKYIGYISFDKYAMIQMLYIHILHAYTITTDIDLIPQCKQENTFTSPCNSCIVAGHLTNVHSPKDLKPNFQTRRGN